MTTWYFILQLTFLTPNAQGTLMMVPVGEIRVGGFASLAACETAREVTGFQDTIGFLMYDTQECTGVVG